jgi:hypothetical protein
MEDAFSSKQRERERKKKGESFLAILKVHG